MFILKNKTIKKIDYITGLSSGFSNRLDQFISIFHSRIPSELNLCRNLKYPFNNLIETNTNFYSTKTVINQNNEIPTSFNLTKTLDIVKGHIEDVAKMRKELGPSLVGQRIPVDEKEDKSSLHYELLAYDDTIKNYFKEIHSAKKRGALGTSMGSQLASQWFPVLSAAIKESQKKFVYAATSEFRQDKNVLSQNNDLELKSMMEFGPYLCELNPDKVSSIIIQETLNSCLSRRTNNIPVIKISQAIGRAVYAQRNFDKMKTRYFGTGKGDARYLYKVNRIAENVERLSAWDKRKSILLGSFLLKKLLEVAKVPLDGKKGGLLVPAFIHEILPQKYTKETAKGHKRIGVISVTESLSKLIYDSHDQRVLTAGNLRYLPMMEKPVDWLSFKSGGYKRLPVIMMRTRDEESKLQRYLIENASEFDDVCEGLNVLNSTKWTIHSRVLQAVEEIWSNGGGLCDIPSRKDFPLPNAPVEDDPEEIRKYRSELFKIRKENRNMHSLRCDLKLKLNVAKEFDHKEFYFPHNIDFRGRAYPIPPHLNHVGGDLNRGLLQFAEGRRIGKRGIYWLKIHLANVAGQDKLSLEDRIKFIDDNIDLIMDSADSPMGGKRFWITADAPFQTLAACIELTDCLRSEVPEDFISRIPVQMDGSCNGLQHYAALGRDVLGALHVNLLPTEKPMDVYVGVLEIVKKYLKKDANNGHPLAKLLVGKVHRKTIKQTVMTTVYGVTLIGAKDQIKKQLKDHPDIPNDDDALIHQCAMYLAQTTFRSLGEVFQSAQRIMAWLNECAYLTAADGKPVLWLTPLGLPIIQPYRAAHQGIVKTVLQDVNVVSELDSLPVNRLRQRSAFPPNYVHSLDASHMFLTAIECHKRGLTFASVHDSYWTHAADTDTLNDIIRDQFIKLHEQPLLESLYENFKTVCPSVDFPPIPSRGSLDLQRVRRSNYFFD